VVHCSTALPVHFSAALDTRARLYTQEGLAVRTKVRKKIARRRPVIVEVVNAPNQL
jgi:hypothetical protein